MGHAVARPSEQAGAVATGRGGAVLADGGAAQLLALQRVAGNAAVARMLGSGGARPPSGGVARTARAAAPARGGGRAEICLQRLAAQITPGTSGAGSIVAGLQIIGRPASPHGDTMGDHSTAFAVQAVSVVDRMLGKTYWEAASQLDGLVLSMNQLPGMALIERSPRLLEKMKTAWQTMTALRNTLQQLYLNAPGAPEVPLLLQQYVVAYLEARELVPLSTVNVKHETPATAGKGHGEARHAKSLRKAGAADGPDAKAATDALIGLFDAQAVGTAAAQLHDVAHVAPGLLDTTGPDERIRLFVTQHLDSAELAYPELLKVPGFTRKDAETKLTELAVKKAQGVATAVVEAWHREAISREAELNRATLAGAGTVLDAKDRKILAKARADRDGAVNELNLAAARLAKLGGPVKEPPPTVATPQPATVDPKKAAAADGLDDEDALADDTPAVDPVDPVPSAAGASGPVPTVTTTSNGTAPVVPTPPVAAVPARTTLAAQLVLLDDGKIGSIEFAGRPASPFVGTMGAHTTAWIVHLDRVRKALLGCTVTEAVANVEATLIPEARTLAARRALQFGPAQSQMLGAASTALDTALAAAKDPDAHQGLHLQALLVRLLSYENLIPGATILAVNTDGRAEGTHRKVLQDYQAGGAATPGALIKAINGLLDVKAAPQAARGLLVTDHREAIERAYPRAAAAAFASTATKRALDPDPHDPSADPSDRDRKRRRTATPEPEASDDEDMWTPGKRKAAPPRRKPPVKRGPRATATAVPTVTPPPQPQPWVRDVSMFQLAPPQVAALPSTDIVMDTV